MWCIHTNCRYVGAHTSSPPPPPCVPLPSLSPPRFIFALLIYSVLLPLWY